MRYLIGFCAVAMFLGAPIASAQESGWAFGQGASFAGEDFDDAGGIDVDDSRSFSAQLAYRVTSWLVLEGEYEYIDEFELSAAVVGIPVRGDVEGYLLSANAKFYPFESPLRPYLMGGIGLADLDASLSAAGLGAFSESDTAALFQLGLGFELNLNDRWSIQVEGAYKLPQSDLDDFDFCTIGATFEYKL